MKKKFALISIFIYILCIFTGCKKSDESTLNIYTTTEDEYIDSYINGFNEKYPDIKLNIVRDSTGVITSKLLAEKENPQADVIWDLAATSLVKIDKTGMLQEYKPNNIDKLNEKFIDLNNKIPHWIGVSLWANAFTVNINELEKKNIAIPQSYNDLLLPEYKNEISMPNPSSSGTGYMVISSLIQSWGEEKAWQYLDKLNNNIKQYDHSGSAPIKSTAMGEQLIGIGMRGESLREEKNSPQIKTVFPKEGLAWDLDGIALVKKDNIKEESKKFIDWILSIDAMNIEAKERNRIVTYKELANQSIYPKNFFEILMKNDIKFSSDNRERIIEEWNKRYK